MKKRKFANAIILVKFFLFFIYKELNLLYLRSEKVWKKVSRFYVDLKKLLVIMLL